MKIAQFIDTVGQGGAERVVLDLSRQLMEQGHEVMALHCGNPYLREECARHGIPAKQLPGQQQYKKMAALPLFTLTLRRFLRRERIDVLHSHLIGPIAGGALATRLAGVRHVGTLHDTYSIAEKPLLLRLIELAALLGTRLVAVSAQMESYYRERGRFTARTLRTIYNGVASSSATSQRAAVRARLGLAPEEVAIISVGRLVEVKRHHLLLEAMRALSGRQLRLFIVGDGPTRQTLKSQAATLGVEDSVDFLGARDDVPELLAGADIFALASRSEGLSCSILEAMAAGLPVVATNVGGNHELIEHGLNGYLTPCNDIAPLIQRLAALAQAPELRAELGEQGRQKARKRFSLAHNLDQYLELYQDGST